jgi:hypothetical protein
MTVHDLQAARLEIEPGWYVEELETSEDCMKAAMALSIAIVQIEQQIEDYQDRLGDLPSEWYRRAKIALKLKKSARFYAEQAYQRLLKRERMELNQEQRRTKERILLEILTEEDPALVAWAESTARSRGLLD